MAVRSWRLGLFGREL